MKLRIQNRFLLSALACIGLASSSAFAATYYWDDNAATTGTNAAPGGTWGTNTYWSTVVAGTGTTANTTITLVDDVFFSAGTTATGSYTVTLSSGAKNARLVTFEDGTPTISGSTLALFGVGGITVASTTVTGATVSSNLTINGGQTFNVAASRSLTLSSGIFTRNNLATLSVSNTGTVTSTMTGLASGGLVNGIVGPWAIFNTGAATRYATFSGNNLAALTGTAAATAANLTDTTGTLNYDLAAATGTTPATMSAHTIRYGGAAATTAPGATLFSVNGLMNAGTGVWTIGTNTVTIGSTRELVVNTANSGVTISSAIANNSGGASDLTKSGTGTLILSGANTYTGRTTINAGTVSANSSSVLGDGSATNALVFGGGTLTATAAISSPSTRPITMAGPGTINTGAFALSLAGNMTGAGWLTKSSTGTLSLSGTNSGYSGTISIDAGMVRADTATALGTGGLSFNGGALGLATNFTRTYNATAGVAGAFSAPGNQGAWWVAYGAERTVSVSGTNTWYNGKNINFGAADSDSFITFSGNLTTQSTASVTRPLIVTRGNGASPIDARMTGVISEQASSLSGISVTGNGIVALTANNTFTGNVIIGGTSTIVANSLAASGTASPIGAGNYGFTLAGGTFQYAPVVGSGAGGHIVNRNFFITGSGSLDASGTGALELSQTGVVSPDATGLSYTATGANAVMTLATPNPNLTIGMRVTGVGIPVGTTINQIQVGGVLTLSANITSTSGTASFGAPTARTLTLTGTNTNANTIAGILQDSSAAGPGVLSIAKTGVGSWVLSGLNTFTGNVTVNGGILSAGVTGNGTNSALGSVSAARTISINTGSTLTASVPNIFNPTFSTPASSLPVLNIAGGTLTNGGAATNSALGNITLTGGTLSATTGSPIGTGQSGEGWGSWNLNGTITSTGSSTISSTAPGGIPITLSADSGNSFLTTFDVQSGTLTASAPFGNVTRVTNFTSTGMTKTGSGAMLLSAANTYTGGTNVSAGTLTVTSTGSLANTAIAATSTGTFAVAAGSGSVSLGNTGTVGAGATLSVASGATFSMLDGAAGGTTNLVQESTFASPALALNTASLTFELAGTSADKLAVTGVASLTGTNSINILPLGSLTAGTYDLITAASGLDTGGTFVFGGSGSTTQTVAYGTEAYTLTLNAAAGAASVTVGTPISITGITWTGQTNGTGAADVNWNNGLSSNWAVGVSPTAFTNGTAVSFEDSNTANGGAAIGSGTVTIAASGVTPTSTTVNNSLVNYTFSGGAIGGTGSITKQGTGSLTLNSANSFSGGLALEAGGVILGNVTAAGSGAISLGSATGSSSASLNITTGTVTNALNVVVNPSAVKTLQAATANSVTFSGDITANDDLAITANLSGTSNTFIVNGAASTIASGKTVSFSTIGTSNGNVTESSLWSGAGAVSYSGSSGGSIVPSGAKTYTGGATLGTMSSTGAVVPTTSSIGPANAPTSGPFGTGTLTIGTTRFRSTSVSEITVGNSISLTGDPTFPTVSGERSLLLTGNVDLGGAPRTLTVDVGTTVTSRSVDFQGVISNGSLTKAGTGTITLSGVNTYNDGTTLSAGTAVINNAASFGTGNVLVTGTSRINSIGGITYPNAIDVGAALTMQNPTITASTAEFSGQLTGSNSITLVSNGTNGVNCIIAFTHPSNTFTGNVILSQSGSGDEFFSFNSLGDAGNFTLQKNGNKQGIIYTGTTDIVFNTRQINIGTTFGNANGGIFDGGGVNPINSFQNNSAANTVTFNSNLSIGAIVAGGGTFFFAGSNTGDNTFAGLIPNSTSGGPLGIGKSGAGKWILANDNSFLGNVIITEGTLSVGKVDVVTNDQPLGKGARIQLGNSSLSGTLEYTGAGDSSTDKQVVIGNLTNNNQVGAGSILNNSSTGALTFSSPTFNFITGTTVTTVDRTLTLGGSNTGNNTITGIIQDHVAGAAQIILTKNGAGTWVLGGANTYSGTTTLNQGTLTVSTGGTLGATTGLLSVNNTNSTAAGTDAILNLPTDADTTKGSLSGTIATPTSGINTVTINNGGAGRNFTVNQTTAGTFPGVIAGDGSFTLGSLSTNTLTLSGANTYTGGTTVNAGTLTLGNASALGTAAATVSGGTLNLNGQTTNNNVSVAALGTLTGSGSIAAATLAGTVTPGGAGSGLITMASATVASTSVITLQLPATGTRGTNFDAITVSGALALDGTITVSITGLTPAIGQSFDLIDSTGPIDVTNFNVATDLVLPTLGVGLAWNTSAFASDGIISIVNSDPYTPWATLKGLTGANNAKNADPDGDGKNNLYEFAFDGDPLSGANDGKIVGKIATVGGNQVLTLTLPVRSSATFSVSGGDQLSALIDGITYRIEGDESLSPFADAITEVGAGAELTAIQTGLPSLATGWTYRTFRAAGTVPTEPKAFLRAKISE